MTTEPLSVGDITLEEMAIRNLDEADVVRLNKFGNLLRRELRPEDPPVPLELTRAGLANIPDFVDFREFWFRDADEEIAASGEVSWTIKEENKHATFVEISVRADHRRRGIAKALLRRLVEVAEEQGRTLMIGGTSERVDAGRIFAERVGARAAQAVHTNRLLISNVDRELVRKWVEQGPVRAEGYSLVAIDGVYPDDQVEAILEVHHVMNTAPRDDLDIEDEYFTVDELRQWEKSMLATGSERWSLFVRHEATGELIGHTEVAWNPNQPKTVFQFGTSVRPDHRGHAIGKWLKATMLERIMAERPEIEDIRTGNADSNDAMLGINHALGFEPYIAATSWQIEVARVRAYLDGS